MSKNINEMNYYEQAKKVHANAVDKGFWDKPHSNEHYFMLVITEATEAVEAHRKGRTASIPEGIEDFPDKAFIPSFEAHIKDTVGDELADTAIRLLDIYGGIIKKKEDTPDITEHVKENYSHASDFFKELEEFTEWTFILVHDLSANPIISTPLLKIHNGLCTLICMAERLGIDLERHIHLKMRYNATRPRLHGKKY